MNAKQRQLRLQDYLEHMLEASRLAQQYLTGIDKAEFLASRTIPANYCIHRLNPPQTTVIRQDKRSEGTTSPAGAVIIGTRDD
jgi:hypothetical protein